MWTIEATVSAGVDQLTSSTQLEVFREAAIAAYPYAVLAPMTEVVVHAAPEEVHWYVHPALSSMWLASDGLIEVVASYGEDQLIELAGAASLRRKAVITCSFAAFELVDGVEEVLENGHGAQNLLTALGVGASATTCRSAWLEADDALTRRFGATPTWGDDVVRLADDAKFLGQVDETLNWVYRAWKVFRFR